MRHRAARPDGKVIWEWGDKAPGGAAKTPLAAREDLPVLTDAEGEFAAAFAAKPGTAWLVRPDGYIGWCSETPSTGGLQSFLKVMVQMPTTSA